MTELAKISYVEISEKRVHNYVTTPPPLQTLKCWRTHEHGLWGTFNHSITSQYHTLVQTLMQATPFSISLSCQQLQLSISYINLMQATPALYSYHSHASNSSSLYHTLSHKQHHSLYHTLTQASPALYIIYSHASNSSSIIHSHTTISSFLYYILSHKQLQLYILGYSKTSLIQAAWDQGVSVTKKMSVTVYCV